MSEAKVVLTREGYLPIPFSLLKAWGVMPEQVVVVRLEGHRLIVEKPSRNVITVELERLAEHLRTGEPLDEQWLEIEQGRERER